MQKSKSNGNLEQAMALLIQNQAAFVAQLHETSKQINEMSKYQVESGRRFARIEDDLEQIKAILAEHGRILAGLPEVIRQKIGFKAKS